MGISFHQPQGSLLLRIIKFSNLEIVPWKNGGGVTREIAALREQGNIIWRLSMADVASDGPFSSFVGLTRVLTVIEGNGIVLSIENRKFEAVLGAPVTFDGGQTTQSKLIDGPIRDLNVMFDPFKCQAEVIHVNGPLHLILRANAKRCIAALGLRGETRIHHNCSLHFGDTVLIESGSIELDLTDKVSALIVTINMLD